MADETTTPPAPKKGKANKPESPEGNPAPEETPAAEVAETPAVAVPKARPLDDRDVRF